MCHCRFETRSQDCLSMPSHWNRLGPLTHTRVHVHTHTHTHTCTCTSTHTHTCTHTHIHTHTHTHQSGACSSHQAELAVTVSLTNHSALSDTTIGRPTLGHNHTSILLVGDSADNTLCKQRIRYEGRPCNHEWVGCVVVCVGTLNCWLVVSSLGG